MDGARLTMDNGVNRAEHFALAEPRDVDPKRIRDVFDPDLALEIDRRHRTDPMIDEPFMARSETKRVSPKEFVDAWKAEIKANGSVSGVVKRLDNRMTKQSVAARAASYRRKKVNLERFASGSRHFDWDGLRAYAGNGHAKTNGKVKSKKAKARKTKA